MSQFFSFFFFFANLSRGKRQVHFQLWRKLLVSKEMKFNDELTFLQDWQVNSC